MRTVWKYEIKMGVFSHSMPQGALVLSVHQQTPGTPQMWVLVDPDHEPEERHFVTPATGHLVPLIAGRFIGTFFIREDEEDMVFHLFEAHPGAARAGS